VPALRGGVVQELEFINRLNAVRGSAAAHRAKPPNRSSVGLRRAVDAGSFVSAMPGQTGNRIVMVLLHTNMREKISSAKPAGRDPTASAAMRVGDSSNFQHPAGRIGGSVDNDPFVFAL